MLVDSPTPTNRKSRHIKGILFDKDGTLINHLPHWIPAVQRALEQIQDQFGGFDLNLAEAVGIHPSGKLLPNRVIGSLAVPGVVNTVRQALLDKGVPAGQAQAASEWFSEALDLVPRGDYDTLTDLSALSSAAHRNGMTVGLITNDYTESARRQMTDLGVVGEIDFLWGIEEGVVAKPNPSGVVAFCEAFQLEPYQVAYVGDSMVDMETALNGHVGLRISVLTGAGDLYSLRRASHITLNSVAELPAILGKLSLKNRRRWYYTQHKEKILAQQKVYRESNQASIRVQQREYREAKRDEYLQYQRRYYRQVLKPRRESRRIAAEL